MMKVAIRLGALLLAATLMTGCLSQSFQTKVNPDGSGTNVFEVGFEKRMLRMLEGMGQEMPDLFEGMDETIEGLPEEWGARAERFETDRLIGVRIHTSFANLEMLAEQLNSIGNAVSPDEGGEFMGREVGDQPSFVRDVAITTDESGNVTFTATAGVPLPEDVDRAQLEMMQRMFGQIRFGWTIELPTLTRFSPEDAGTRTGNSVRFNFELGRTYELSIVGTLAPTSGGGSSEVQPEEPAQPEEPQRPAEPEEEESEEDRQVDSTQLESYLAGTWRFDLASLRRMFSEQQEMPEEFLDMILEQFTNVRVTFGNGVMRVTDAEGEEQQTNRYKITSRGERTLTLQNEDGENLVITFETRNRITIQSDDMPGALTLLRVRD